MLKEISYQIFQKTNDVGRVGVLTNTGTTSKRVAEKFKFQFCATKEDRCFR